MDQRRGHAWVKRGCENNSYFEGMGHERLGWRVCTSEGVGVYKRV
jgi:hypothetical protein